MPRVGDDPVARRRRGGRMIDRRERPSSIVGPEPNFSKMELARAASRRRQRVALTDRASMDKDERERGSVWLIALIFQCRLFGATPYLAALARAGAAVAAAATSASSPLSDRPQAQSLSKETPSADQGFQRRGGRALYGGFSAAAPRRALAGLRVSNRAPWTCGDTP